MGFNNNKVGNNLYDLSIDNKIYLYFLNIDNKMPFGILYYSGITEAEIKFDKPVSLDNLIISFKDVNNFPINFYNLKHSLDLQISVSE